MGFFSQSFCGVNLRRKVRRSVESSAKLRAKTKPPFLSRWPSQELGHGEGKERTRVRVLFASTPSGCGCSVQGCSMLALPLRQDCSFVTAAEILMYPAACNGATMLLVSEHPSLTSPRRFYLFVASICVSV